MEKIRGKSAVRNGLPIDPFNGETAESPEDRKPLIKKQMRAAFSRGENGAFEEIIFKC